MPKYLSQGWTQLVQQEFAWGAPSNSEVIRVRNGNWTGLRPLHRLIQGPL